jgi:hypothetical protein
LIVLNKSSKCYRDACKVKQMQRNRNELLLVGGIFVWGYSWLGSKFATTSTSHLCFFRYRFPKLCSNDFAGRQVAFNNIFLVMLRSSHNQNDNFGMIMIQELCGPDSSHLTFAAGYYRKNWFAEFASQDVITQWWSLRSSHHLYHTRPYQENHNVTVFYSH